MGTLSNPPHDPRKVVKRDPDECRKARWCDEPDGHIDACRRYLGEARGGTPRRPIYVGVALVGTTQRDRRLELSGATDRVTFDWSQVQYLASLLSLAHKSYAS
jgi:hypothetical protein